MKKVAVVGCGSYMDSGYGCPGEWRCLKAATMGDGKFDEPSQVVSGSLSVNALGGLLYRMLAWL